MTEQFEIKTRKVEILSIMKEKRDSYKVHPEPKLTK